MKLILSDRHINIPLKENSDIELIDLSKCKISNCIGCYGCWTKTPGKCVIRDDAVKIYPKIAASDKIIYVSKIAYGGYDSVMKTMLERAIPVQQAFIRLLDGETHHLQRSVAEKTAVIIGYGNISYEEQDIFRQLISRNAKNMKFKNYRIVFTTEDKLEQSVEKEVLKWQEY